MTATRRLEGLTALVTGGTSGIGRAVAEELGRQGAEVILQGRDSARGESVVSAITADGGKARFVAADLSDPRELQRLVEEVGSVDVLVNNAGFAWNGPTAELDVATFDKLFATNVRAPYFLVAAFAPKMVARGGGCIVNVGSVVGDIGLAGAAAYGATKAAIALLTRAWAAELSPAGVRVNAVAPGPVHTTILSADQIDALGATTLLRRAGEPEEIANVIAFLASSDASYVTGAIVAADGGRGSGADFTASGGRMADRVGRQAA
jgi:NAD(P)-dependent dehydrogenase (short-subunit alcohol dehydrogenase family)